MTRPPTKLIAGVCLAVLCAGGCVSIADRERDSAMHRTVILPSGGLASADDDRPRTEAVRMVRADEPRP